MRSIEDLRPAFSGMSHEDALRLVRTIRADRQTSKFLSRPKAVKARSVAGDKKMDKMLSLLRALTPAELALFKEGIKK